MYSLFRYRSQWTHHGNKSRNTEAASTLAIHSTLMKPKDEVQKVPTVGSFMKARQFMATLLTTTSSLVGSPPPAQQLEDLSPHHTSLDVLLVDNEHLPVEACINALERVLHEGYHEENA